MRGVARLLVLLAAALMAAAQQPPRPQSVPMHTYTPRVTATVTGHVTCSDTQRAARYALVTLVAVQSPEDEGRGFAGRHTARTDLNGDFSVQAEPGDYYVTAAAPGYASLVAEAESRLSSGATADDLLSKLPQVHVSADGGGPVNLTIDRGGVISGKLQWEDGSPAAGVNVNAMTATAAISTAAEPEMNRLMGELGGGFGGYSFQMNVSDDRGVFRITGLAAGSYLVRATVMTPLADSSHGFGGRISNIILYAPGKVRKADAQTIELKAGEERDDVQFTLDVSALHTVSGHATSTDEGGSVASGLIRMTDSQDSTLSRVAFIQPDGSFVIQWVPAGTYTLSVANATNLPTESYGYRGPQSNGASTVSYQPFQETLTVTDSDLTGLGISMTPVSSTH